MVMLQSPVKTTDSTQTAATVGQMSPKSHPDSPKSNTSPEVQHNIAGGISPTAVVNSPTAKATKFVQNQQQLPTNNVAALQQTLKSTATNEESLRYSLECLKQMTDNSKLNRYSPTTEDSDSEKCINNNNNNSSNNNNNNTTRRSQSPVALPNSQQRKLLELASARQLARPEPLQHPHAALLQQHPHLLQNPQFLAAAAAQHHHHQQQQLHHNPHQSHHAFHLRPPFPTATTTLTIPINATPPSPANSPLSPPTSPLQPHSEQLQQQHQLLSPSATQQHSTHPLLQGHPQLLSSPPSSMLLTSHTQQQQQQQQQQATANSSPSSTTIHDMDLERIKLVAAQAVARSTSSVAACTTVSTPASMTANAVSASGLCLPPTNPRTELSDYGFRIQLGGLAAAAAAAAATSRQIAAANYARSDTSEELNVDGNDEESNDGSNGTPSVSFAQINTLKKFH
ncbi:homeobox protein slou-like [Teleopsis dalmanni]|uniref:homeobox protein slou-like n=1 Tax=Teleopsis dalmanni TaxID=139649 RepID=UPI0018CC92EF|nr:homeobox protein slou-like [Teleopsis dalmanni]